MGAVLCAAGKIRAEILGISTLMATKASTTAPSGPLDPDGDFLSPFSVSSRARTQPEGQGSSSIPLSMLTIALTLLALAPDEPAAAPSDDGKPEEAEEWTGTLSAGLTTSSGNTERRSIHAQVDAALRQEKRRYSVGFDWQYADEAEDGPSELLERRASTNGQVDFFLDEQSYLLVTADVETDHKAELELRYSAGVGYGYQVAEEEDWSLSLEAGMSVINEQFVGVDEDSYLSGRFGYALKRDIGERWTFSQDSEIFPSFEETEDIHLEVDSRLRCDLSDNLYGQFQWLFDWDNTPADGAERADHRILLSVGYSF